MSEYITLGDNTKHPVVNIKKAAAVYDCVRTEEFDIATFNSLLFAVVTYLDCHNVKYGDKALPWAESQGLIQQRR